MSDDTITVKSEAGAVHIDRPHIATLPTGERVELPAGTVLHEGTDGIDPTKLLQRIKDLQDDRARQHAEIERLRAQIETSATPADRAVGAAMLGSLR